MGTVVASATTLVELRRGSGETLYDVPTLLPSMNCTRRVFTAVALQEICSQVGSDSLTVQKARFDNMFSAAKVGRPDQTHGIESAGGSEYVDIYLPTDALSLSPDAPLGAKLAAAAALGGCSFLTHVAICRI